MIPLLAVSLAVLLAGIAWVHFYWAFGGLWGYEAALPMKPEGSGSVAGGSAVFRPGPIATFAVAAFLGVAALVALAAGGLLALPVPSGFVRFGIWALAIVLLLRALGDFGYVGLSKRVRGTRFAVLDTRFFTPLCLVLAALAFGVAFGSA